MFCQSDFPCCKCNMFEHFVGKRWHCLSRFFVKETKAHQVKARCVVAYIKGEQNYFGPGSQPGSLHVS